MLSSSSANRVPAIVPHGGIPVPARMTPRDLRGAPDPDGAGPRAAQSPAQHGAPHCTEPPDRVVRGLCSRGRTRAAPTVRGGDQMMDRPPVRAFSKRSWTSAQFTMFQKALT
ncbi:hypothetical protein GCM10009696_15010 [Kocuria himachalensis]